MFSALGVCVAFSGWGPLSADGASSVATGVSSCSETSRFLTVTGSAVFTVRTRLRVRSACSWLSSSTLAAFSAGAGAASSSPPVLLILSINSCLRNLSASAIPINLAISRNSDTSLAFNSLISINVLCMIFGFFLSFFLNSDYTLKQVSMSKCDEELNDFF